MKKFIVIRHCKAEGQEIEARLTKEGELQSLELKEFFLSKGYYIDKIISSPYKRAIDSVNYLAKELSLPIHVDERLGERVLSNNSLPNWRELLEQTFVDIDMSLEGGESSRDAITRAVAVIREQLDRKDQTILIVTHGNLMTLLLKHFDSKFGFNEWSQLSNPDVYEIEEEDDGVNKIKRVWNTTILSEKS
ncbi:histidine phosphatase family protein [Microbacteriaceae bacterium 4G12]